MSSPLSSRFASSRRFAPPLSTTSAHMRWGVGSALIWLLALLELVLAYSSGSYFPLSWLPVLLFVAALTAVVFAFGPTPAVSKPTTLLLSLFGLQLAWTAASLLWAVSPGNVWEEANRSGLFALGLLLSALAVRWVGTRGTGQLVLALVVSLSGLAAGLVFRVAVSAAPLEFFASGRLHYPVSYWNGLAALLMIGFWLSLGMASSRDLPRWTLPLLVTAAALFAELAFLPQSRGWLWTFIVVAPWFLVLSPHRFRALFHLLVVLAAVLLAWGPLSSVYQAAGRTEAIEPAISNALSALLISAVGVFIAAGCGQLIERSLPPVGPGLRRRLGVLLLVIGLLSGALGLVAADAGVEGGLRGWAGRARQQIAADAGPEATVANRFSDVGLTGRLQQWRIAWQAFEEHPVLGLGAQNFEFYFYEHRTTGLVVKQPHSQPMQLLAELGLPGVILWLVFFVAVLLRAVGARFRADRPGDQAAIAALVLAALSWFVHSSGDWLWQLAGVSWPAMLILGGLAGLAPAAPGRARPGAGRACRIAVAALAAVLFASALFPYLSLRYERVAYRNLLDPATALAAAATSARLNPLTSSPLQARAKVLHRAAEKAAATEVPGRGWTVLDDLGLAVLAMEEARTREPAGWSLAYRTGLALIEFRRVTALSRGAGIASRPEPHDPWVALGAPDAWQGSTGVGLGRDSLARAEVVAAGPLAALQSLRAQSPEELAARGRRHLLDARRLNPRDQDIRQALTVLETGATP